MCFTLQEDQRTRARNLVAKAITFSLRLPWTQTLLRTKAVLRFYIELRVFIVLRVFLVLRVWFVLWLLRILIVLWAWTILWARAVLWTWVIRWLQACFKDYHEGAQAPPWHCLRSIQAQIWALWPQTNCRQKTNYLGKSTRLRLKVFELAENSKSEFLFKTTNTSDLRFIFSLKLALNNQFNGIK